MSEPRFEDYDYTYNSSNMWTFLGNGWTQLETRDTELGGTLDLAWYLQKPAEILHAPDS